MDEIVFSWNYIKDKWNEMYQELLKFKETYGHPNVPQLFSENPDLGTWVNTQRFRNKNGRMSNDQLRKLEEIDFAWHPDGDSWQKMFQALIEFKEIHGHCVVPRSYKENPKLIGWVLWQRRYYDMGSLLPDRIKQLSEIGFSWHPIKDLWNENYQALLEFKRLYGHCNVTRNYKGNPTLATWVNTQRTRKRRGVLKPDEIEKLEELGFWWNPKEDHWNFMFQQLVKFKNKHGHCRATSSLVDDKKFLNWLIIQRTTKRQGKISHDRLEKLDQIGFLWNPDEDYWNEMFQELIKYKEKYGDCNVPQSYPHNPKLGHFVSVNRRGYKKGKLDSGKVEKLSQLGFEWNRRKTKQATEVN